MLEKTSSPNKRIFKVFVYRNKAKISLALDRFFKGVKLEAKDTKQATKLIGKFLTKGSLTKEEEKFIRLHAYDLLKVAGIGIPFVFIPGATIIIPFVVKAAQKRNIDILPNHFKNVMGSPSDSKNKSI